MASIRSRMLLSLDSGRDSTSKSGEPAAAAPAPPPLFSSLLIWSKLASALLAFFAALPVVLYASACSCRPCAASWDASNVVPKSRDTSSASAVTTVVTIWSSRTKAGITIDMIGWTSVSNALFSWPSACANSGVLMSTPPK